MNSNESQELSMGNLEKLITGVEIDTDLLNSHPDIQVYLTI